MKRTLIIATLFLSACTATPEVATYRESEKVDVCVTWLTAPNGLTDLRKLSWRYHPCSKAEDTIAAGAHVSPSVVESLAGAAGALGGGLIIGEMIGPSGHATPREITVRGQ